MPLPYPYARRGYLEWYSQLLTPPDTDYKPNQSLSIVDALENNLKGFNLASEELTASTAAYLDHADHYLRIAALDSLLHQIEGDLSVAGLVWRVMTAVENGQDEEALHGLLKRSALQEAYLRLSYDVHPQIEQTALRYHGVAVGVMLRRPENLEQAVHELSLEVQDTLARINSDAASVGVRLTRSVLALGQTDWDSVTAGIDILQGEQRVGNIGWGLEDDFSAQASGLAGMLRTILISAVEKLLLLTSKNDLIRYTITDWLEELRAVPPTEQRAQFKRLIEHLYQTEVFANHFLPIWVNDAATVDNVHLATDLVLSLGDSFERLARQINRIGLVIRSEAAFLHPHLKSTGLAFEIGLLGVLVFGGYDHLDEGTRALNITRGVREVLIQHLPVSAQTQLYAENLRMKVVREKRATGTPIRPR